MNNAKFCGQIKTVKHPCLGCSLARLVWQVILCALGLNRPHDDVKDLLADWIQSFPMVRRKLFLRGGGSNILVISKDRNGVCFMILLMFSSSPSDPYYLSQLQYKFVLNS